MVEVIFIAPPKTAGYTIGRCLKDAKSLKDGYGFNHGIARKIIKPEHFQSDVPIMCVVRNPYDRLYSIYEFYKKKKTDIHKTTTFKQFIMTFEKTFYLKKPQFNTCHDFVVDKDGKILATDVLKFESLDRDYDVFCKKYKIKNNLIKRNVNELKDENIDWKKLYDDDMRSVVEKIFKKDLEVFNYSYTDFINSK